MKFKSNAILFLISLLCMFVACLSGCATASGVNKVAEKSTALSFEMDQFANDLEKSEITPESKPGILQMLKKGSAGLKDCSLEISTVQGNWNACDTKLREFENQFWKVVITLVVLSIINILYIAWKTYRWAASVTPRL